ncbi:GNAT family N-acetyltransferase [Candidatus Nomurabacteria bacterium]|nr:GNAT family N-acetyltransferase [Candidatus Nomurabacteria bacterium]
MLKLIKPTKEYGESWLEALKEFREAETEGFWNILGEPDDVDEYINKTSGFEKGVNMPEESWVPNTTFWLVDGDQFIGHVNIRHKLTEKLEKVGGHIGYAIRPSRQGQGYGNKILEMVIPKSKNLGLDKLLLVCNKDNIASNKIIKNNGGEFRDEIEVDGEKVFRYWINI